MLSPDARSSSQAFACSFVVRASERDADLGTELVQLVDRALLGRTHVRGRDHAHPPTALDHRRERLAQMPDTRPDDEGADEIDRVGAGKLGTQLGADVGLPLGVDQQIALAERGRRGRREVNDVSQRGNPLDAKEHPGGEGNLCRRAVATCELAQDVVDSLRLVVGGLVVPAEPPPKLLHGMSRKPLRRLSRIEPLLESNVFRELAQLRGERVGDQVVARPGVSRGHAPR